MAGAVNPKAFALTTAALIWGGANVQVHHIQPLMLGGQNTFWNMVPLSHSDHLLFSNWWRYYSPGP